MQRKHAFPGMVFIINERLCGPLYGRMFCAAPILSSGPARSFPPSPPLHLSIKDHDWARMAGSPSSAVKVRPSFPSLPLFMPPYHLKFFHLAFFMAPQQPLPSCYPCTFFLLLCGKSHICSQLLSNRSSNFFKRGCKAWLPRPHRVRPDIIWK